MGEVRGFTHTYAVWLTYGTTRRIVSGMQWCINGVETMTTYPINLEGLHTVAKAPRSGDWAASYAIDLAKLPGDIVARLALHGLTQKIADAASGAKTKDEAFAAMAKAGDALLAGQWAVRAASGGVTDDKVALVNLVAGVLQGDKRKAFNALPFAERLEKAEKNAAKFTADMIAGEVARIVAARAERDERKAALAALAGDIEIDL